MTYLCARLRYPLAALAVAAAIAALFLPEDVASVVLVVLSLAAAIAVAMFLIVGFQISPRCRVVHGLEHATAAVIEEQGVVVPRGAARAAWFTLDIPNEAGCDLDMVTRAVHEAIARLGGGETTLAYDRGCGTIGMVRILLAALAILAGGIVHVATVIPAVPLLAAALVLAYATTPAAFSVGMLVQRLVTVSPRFAEATVLGVHGGLYEHQRRYTVELRVRCRA